MQTDTTEAHIPQQPQSVPASAEGAANTLPYPAGLYRILYRLPLTLYRLGLGGLLNLASIMVLTTRGRSSGLPRYTPIEYRPHGSKIYAVSGWGTRPNWVRNLTADPNVSLRQGQRAFAARAQVVEDSSEALRVLHLFRKRAPAFYDSLIARLSGEAEVNNRTLPDVSRLLTIVRFDPAPTEGDLPAIQADLKWLWLVALLGGVLLALLRRRGHDRA